MAIAFSRARSPTFTDTIRGKKSARRKRTAKYKYKKKKKFDSQTRKRFTSHRAPKILFFIYIYIYISVHSHLYRIRITRINVAVVVAKSDVRANQSALMHPNTACCTISHTYIFMCIFHMYVRALKYCDGA